jgi:hypothetical protein
MYTRKEMYVIWRGALGKTSGGKEAVIPITSIAATNISAARVATIG